MALESKDLGRRNHFFLNWLGIAFSRLASASSGLNRGCRLATIDLRGGGGAAASVVLLRELGDCGLVLPSAGLGLGDGESGNDSESLYDNG